MPNSPRLILASSSPQRRTLLADAGYAFEVVEPHESAECGACSTGGPAELVAELAMRKAQNVIEQISKAGDAMQDPPPIVIACDTVAESQGQILGKPTDADHAAQMLEMLSGTVHRVYSGLCIWPLADKQQSVTRVAVTELRMEELGEDEIDDYIQSGLWRGKAGGFGLQDRPGWLHVERGSITNVIGLPTELLGEMLAGLR